jgi:hypothetical protein
MKAYKKLETGAVIEKYSRSKMQEAIQIRLD